MHTPINYIILDAARMNTAMDSAKELNHLHESLYKGESKNYLNSVAPYLFSFPGNAEFSNWYLQNGWDNAWGIMVSTRLSFEDCLHHFKKFVVVKTENGPQHYFRFYDPRVLKIFLPTCDKKQVTEFFGPIDYILVEGDTSETAIRLWHEYGKFKQEELSKDELFQQELLSSNG